MPSFLNSGGSMHHYWVSALKHTKFHFRKQSTATSSVLKEPWHVFLAPNYMCHWSICICDVSIYMFKYFVSSGLILNFNAFCIQKIKKKAHKECCDVFGICSHAYFYLDFLIVACQNKFLITIGLYWKKKSLFILLSYGAETQVNELENSVASCT